MLAGSQECETQMALAKNASGIACSLEYIVLWWDLSISTRETPRMSTGVEYGQVAPIAELGELIVVAAYASIIFVAKPETSAPAAMWPGPALR